MVGTVPRQSRLAAQTHGYVRTGAGGMSRRRDFRIAEDTDHRVFGVLPDQLRENPIGIAVRAAAIVILDIREIRSVGNACGGSSLEDRYFEVLSSAVSYRVRDDNLIVTARNGDTLQFYKD